MLTMTVAIYDGDVSDDGNGDVDDDGDDVAYDLGKSDSFNFLSKY